MKKFEIFVGVVAMLGAIGSVHAQSNDRCRLVTQAEATVAFGAAVRPGEIAISGCQWGQIGGDGFVQIQVAGAQYYQRPPKTAKKTNKLVVIAWALGDKASSEKVVDLLRLVVDRVEREP
jgi:hypothetical protein